MPDSPRKAVLYWGIWPYLDDYPFMPTEQLLERVGLNTGNLAFAYAIQRQLDMLEKNGAPNKINIYTCANLLGEHTDMGREADRLAREQQPAVAIGLGAQAAEDIEPDLPQGTLRWLENLVSHAPVKGVPNICVRGEFTRSTLEKHGFGDAAVVTGCPSLFINPDISLGSHIKDRYLRNTRPALSSCTGRPGAGKFLRRLRGKPASGFSGNDKLKIAVLAGHSWDKWLYKMENSLVRLLDEHSGSYIVQSDPPMMHLARGEKWGSLNSRELYRQFINPKLADPEFLDWWKANGRIFFDAAAWLDFYKNFDFAIGARMHGIILALQAGIPAICISHDARTRELCMTMRIPSIDARKVAGGVTLADVKNCLDAFDAGEFDANRRWLCETYISFLERNGVEIDAKFRSWHGGDAGRCEGHV